MEAFEGFGVRLRRLPRYACEVTDRVSESLAQLRRASARQRSQSCSSVCRTKHSNCVGCVFARPGMLHAGYHELKCPGRFGSGSIVSQLELPLKLGQNFVCSVRGPEPAPPSSSTPHMIQA